MRASGTTSQFAIRAVVDELARTHVATAQVLRAAGIAPELAAAVDARFPVDRALALWERAAEATHDPDFGAHVAAQLCQGYGLHDYLFVTSRTVREGYERLAASVRIAYDESDLRVTATRDALELVRAAGPHARQYDEFVVGFLVCCGRRASGVEFAPRAVTVAHERGDGAGAFEALLHCPVTYGAKAISITLPREVGELPSRHADSKLHEVLEDYARTLLARLPATHDLVASVRSAIVRALPHELLSIDGVARELKMSVRSLQRRLRDQTTTFVDVVDDVRRELALEYLANASLSIGEITYLLRFSEVAAFARAFKRWMRATPAEYRARLFGE